MFSTPHFSECFDTLTEDQKDDEFRARQHHEEEISSLPRHEGWRQLSLRLYKGFWFPEAILPGVLSLRHHLRPTSSDIFLVSFPKSGTTWLKALAFAISTRKPELLQSRHPQDCSPNLETFFAGPRVPDLDALPSPRQLSTHIPYSVLPKSVHDSPCRIIYLCREPKDTLVSTYHFVNGMHRPEAAPQMPLTEAVELFCKGLTMYGPVWEHQLEYWQESQRRPEKVLFLKYEDLMADPEAIVRRMAEYMGKPFSAAEEMNGMVGEIVRFSSFEKLSGLEINKVGLWGKEFDLDHLAIKKSSFFRNGKVGDWTEHFTAEMAERFDAIARDKFHQSGLTHSHSSV
ncbi:hypothetical protein KFK09_021876 [Dendrobium nobile]|uniref:Sulfotransferase n=1 Tax=Dendrobium nobile TaxID=94219 RepID=A0A8T3AMZ9_DENNO|nr:hypothetical protein KFK09_021876 [Dendrobium nobile]